MTITDETFDYKYPANFARVFSWNMILWIPESAIKSAKLLNMFYNINHAIVYISSNQFFEVTRYMNYNDIFKSQVFIVMELWTLWRNKFDARSMSLWYHCNELLCGWWYWTSPVNKNRFYLTKYTQKRSNFQVHIVLKTICSTIISYIYVIHSA